MCAKMRNGWVALRAITLLLLLSALDASNLPCTTRMFAEKLLQQYGTDGALSEADFGDLLGSLGPLVQRPADRSLTGASRQASSNSTTSPSTCSPSLPQCSTVEALFGHYAVNSQMKVDDFVNALPASLNSVLSHNCLKNKTTVQTRFPAKVHHKPSQGEVWGYGIGVVTLICVISNVGGLLGPIMHLDYFKRVLMFLVALAVGALATTGVLVLIPEAFGMLHCPELADDYLWKAAVCVAGIYIFFVFERIVKIAVVTHSRPPSQILHVEVKDNCTDDASQASEEVTNMDIADQVHSHFLDVTSAGCGHEKMSVKTVAWMVLLGDALHNLVDGLSIGAAFTENVYTGLSISIAVLCEELPHELGDIAILLHSGLSLKKALLYNFLAATTAYLGLLLGVVLGENTQANRWIFAVAAGIFLYVALVDMLPEMSATADRMAAGHSSVWPVLLLQLLGLLSGFVLIVLVARFSGDIAL